VLALIWAQAEGGVLGYEGKIPWRLPEDQAQFKALTTGSTVLMGRLTWESLPSSVRPLPGRRNLVITSDSSWVAEGAERVSSIETAIALADGDLWVIGGAAVYSAALPFADRVVVTLVDLECVGDVVAPELGPEWSAVFGSDWQTSSTGLRYKVTTYRRPAAIPSTP
jgi:dihydrofolate reductase